MGVKLPLISGAALGRILVRLGFRLASQRGSHMKFERPYSGGKEIVIVPNHKTLRKGTLHSILKQLKLDAANLKKLM